MMNSNRVASIAFLVVTIFLYIAAAINFLGVTADKGRGVVFLLLGSAFLCLGAVFLKKEKEK